MYVWKIFYKFYVGSILQALKSGFDCKKRSVLFLINTFFKKMHIKNVVCFMLGLSPTPLGYFSPPPQKNPSNNKTLHKI